ncbi:MAG: hypothetical protein FWB86_11810 [Treponema sp.]|nr:hypothetical protein [Treponema sp.]MCL2273107.1 hypothetical protein [Treponema sp.]
MTDNEKTVEEAKKDILPFESWEQLDGESAEAFAAFRIYRDYGYDRNIKKAIDSAKEKKAACSKSYGTWRSWAVKYRWTERAANYDRHIEGLKQTELRKTIEAQWEKYRQVTGKMLDVVLKKLDTMNPEDLTQGNLPEWVETSAKTDLEITGFVAPNGKTENKQGEFNFLSDFQGL